MTWVMPALAVLVPTLGWTAVTGVYQTPAGAPPGRSVPVGERGLTAEEARLQELLIYQATEEPTSDTGLLDTVRLAAQSAHPRVRANALAGLATATEGLRRVPSDRTRRRQADIAEAGWPIAIAALGDGSGTVRRYAVTALVALASTEDQRLALLQRCRSLFEVDAEPVVRAAAFGCLLNPPRVTRTAPAVDWPLVERAIADPSPVVKAAAFSGVWAREGPQSQAFVLRFLNDERDGATRVAAAEALRNVVVSDASVVEAVAARLAVETDPQVRERMAGALAQMREIAAKTKKR
jgi:hypothetical protein